MRGTIYNVPRIIHRGWVIFSSIISQGLWTGKTSIHNPSEFVDERSDLQCDQDYRSPVMESIYKIPRIMDRNRASMGGIYNVPRIIGSEGNECHPSYEGNYRWESSCIILQVSYMRQRELSIMGVQL